MSMDETCKKVADAVSGALEKVFDDVANREQIGDFFDDAMALVTSGVEAAGWSGDDKKRGIWRTSGYLNLSLSKSLGELSDEVKPAVE